MRRPRTRSIEGTGSRGARQVGAAALVVALAWAQGARADVKQQCIETSERGQSLRDDHKLSSARAAFRKCADAACPTVIRKDCTEWIVDVDARLPSVVLGARNAVGDDVTAVRVTLDGEPLVSRLDGTAVPVDPGEHTFVFEADGFATISRRVVIREGEKARLVSVDLPARDRPNAEARAARAPSQVERPAESRSAQRTIGLLVGGAGLVAVGAGAYFGVKASSGWDDFKARCSPERCTDASARSVYEDAHDQATLSTIFFVGGVAGVAAGALLFLSAPAKRSSARAIVWTPRGGRDGAAMTVDGRF